MILFLRFLFAFFEGVDREQAGGRGRGEKEGEQTSSCKSNPPEYTTRNAVASKNIKKPPFYYVFHCENEKKKTSPDKKGKKKKNKVVTKSIRKKAKIKISDKKKCISFFVPLFFGGSSSPPKKHIIGLFFSKKTTVSASVQAFNTFFLKKSPFFFAFSCGLMGEKKHTHFSFPLSEM